MVHLLDILEVELIASTIVIIVLLVLSVVKKDEMLSDSALAKLRLHYGLFKFVFALSIVGVGLFLFVLYDEALAWHRGFPGQRTYSSAVEMVLVSLSFIALLVSLLNMYLVARILEADR